MTGKTPFVGGTSKKKEETKEVLFNNILNVSIEFPEDFPTLAKSFVLGMIKRNPKERMNIEEIKNHPWLRKNNDNLQPIIATSVYRDKKNSRDLPNIEKIDESVEIINDLNKKILELEEELAVYKIN